MRFELQTKNGFKICPNCQSEVTEKFMVSRMRVYVLCDNIFYWSAREGLDSRYSFTGTTAYAVNSPVRTLSGGISVTF
jgi:hypothetical protein